MSVSITSQNGSTQYENYLDRWYREYVRGILEVGRPSGDRTGTGTTKRFGQHARFDLRLGFPLLTTKAVWFEGVVKELLWMLRGQTNVKHLVEQGCSIWTDNAYSRYREKARQWSGVEMMSKEEFEEKLLQDESFADHHGDMGPIYGKLWRGYHERVMISDDGTVSVEPLDQIERLIENLQSNPDSRRHIVSAWNPAELDSMALPPCHYGFQCYSEKMSAQERHRWAQKNGYNVSSVERRPEDYGEKDHRKYDEMGVPRRSLSLMWNQRSVDSFLGLPFNIASYALLTHMLARQVGMAAKEVIFSGGDCHVYDNHQEQVEQQISRVGRKSLPTLSLPEEVPDDPADYSAEDISVEGYDPHPPIEAEVAVE